MALADRIRRWFPAPEAAPRSDWEGVYAGFDDVPALGGFDDDAWAADTRRLTQQVREECAARGAVPVQGDSALLPVLAGSVLASAGRVCVLDFGGGMGISFLQLGATARDAGRIEYHVVETARVCEEGARFHSGDARIQFHLGVPDLPGIDIAFLNSSLQYVKDVRGLLQSLCALGPKFVLLVRSAVGETPTFASAQVTLPGKRIPYWFLNRGELTSTFREFGYSLSFAARSTAKLEQAALPQAYRQGWAMNLLFARTTQA